MVGKWWVCSGLLLGGCFLFVGVFFNKQRKSAVNYPFVTRELRQLEEHVAGDGVAASRSTADGRDDANAERDAQRATRRDLERLLADLPTGNRALPCRSAAPSCVCGEARTGWATEQQACFSPSNRCPTTRQDVFCKGRVLVAASRSAVVWDLTGDLAEDTAITIYSPSFRGKGLTGGGFAFFFYFYFSQ